MASGTKSLKWAAIEITEEGEAVVPEQEALQVIRVRARVFNRRRILRIERLGRDDRANPLGAPLEHLILPSLIHLDPPRRVQRRR